MNQVRMIKSNGSVTNTEMETIRRKKGRNKVNEGTVQESDNIGDNDDENVDINQAHSATEEPITIIQNDLSNCERNRILRLREILKGDDFGETEVNLRKKLKEEVIKMNKVLEHVKITGFTHCRNVLQAAMKIV